MYHLLTLKWFKIQVINQMTKGKCLATLCLGCDSVEWVGIHLDCSDSGFMTMHQDSRMMRFMFKTDTHQRFVLIGLLLLNRDMTCICC